MKKTAKILSIVLSISMVIGVALALVFSAFAADAPTFELKEIKNTASEIVVEINLTDGQVSNLDIVFNQSGVTCTSIDSDYATVNPAPPAGFSNISMASLKPVKAPATIATVTLKVDNADKNSFSIEFTSCGVPDSEADVSASVKVVNNNVSYKAPTTTTTTKAPTTTTTTKAPTTTTTTKAPATTTTTKAPATTTTTKAPATTTTTKAPVTTTADGNTPATTTAAADAPADPSANPSTGESVAAAVAAVAVLGISGAAVVALRKKED